MKIKRLLLFLSVLFCSSCLKEYVYITKVVIENKSGYDLEITSDGTAYTPKLIKIAKGGTFSLSKDAEGGFVGVRTFIPAKCAIRFGDQVVVDHRSSDQDEYHNFCSESAYSRNQQGKQESFVFTFTNADYGYAKEHPMN